MHPLMTPRSHQVTLTRFTLYYMLVAVPILAITVGLMAVRFATNDVYYHLPVSAYLIYLIPAAVVNTCISYSAQSHRVRGWLAAHPSREQFSILRFVWLFYRTNLAVSIVLSGVSFPILMFLIFTLVTVPIFLWLLPTHVLIGLVLGQMIKQRLPRRTAH